MENSQILEMYPMLLPETLGHFKLFDYKENEI